MWGISEPAYAPHFSKGEYKMLRDYQDGTLNAVVTAFDAGINRQLAALATGAGKTVIFSNLPERLESRLPGQMWVIAHREELIDQAVTKIRQWNPSLIVDKEMAEHYANPAADVIVSCIASIGRKGTARANRFDWEDVTKVVIDEAHHTNAQTYLNFLHFGRFPQVVPRRPKAVGIPASGLLFLCVSRRCSPASSTIVFYGTVNCTGKLLVSLPDVAATLTV
jgi:ATP-dependent helicase IRC3